MVTLKFITDGSPRGNRVVVAETGDEVKGIKSVTIYAEAGKFPTMTLEVIKTEITAVGTVEGYILKEGHLVTEKVECVPMIEVNAKEKELV